MSIKIDVKTAKIGFWHFPRIFHYLVLMEFCERFAFYGVQSIAILYFIEKYSLSEANASSIFSSFSALCYALLVIGGTIGDKLIGISRAYLIGICLFVIGYGLLGMANTANMLYYAMGIIICGNMFFKTNANNYISRCLENNDPRLDSAYTYFYMFINIGSCLSFAIVPFVAKSFGYSIGLYLSCIAMCVSLLLYIIFKNKFDSVDNQIGKSGKNKLKLSLLCFFGTLCVSYPISLILADSELSLLLLVGAAVLFTIIYFLVAFRLPRHELRGMLIAFILLLQAILFWVLCMQTSTSFVLFARHNIDLTIFGFTIPVGSTQIFNSIHVIAFSPILANLYILLEKKGIHLNIPYKFTAGIFITGCCFLLLGFSSTFFVNSAYQISIIWLFASYGFYSVGELLISALGPSMVAQLLPKRLGGFAQGMWYLTCAVGMRLGGMLSSMEANEYDTSNPSQSLHVFNQMFYQIGFSIVLISVLLFFIAKPLTRQINQALAHRV